mmetsp:Transcript_32831/g.103950  ORF Transcript_32831/g.103950 Transcript_32831/m.103950 type:complete len:249 (-) Transcript_32831:84-830(-)
MEAEGGDGPYATFESELLKVETTSEPGGCEVAKTLTFGDAQQLELGLIMAPDEIEPLFSGAAWAGTTLWPAATLLCDFILNGFDHGRMKPGARVLELGAGLGAPGFVAAALGADVVITEQQELVRLLAQNAARNFAGEAAQQVSVRALDWSAAAASEITEAFGGWDVVLASDVVYEPLYGDSWQALADCLQALLLPSPSLVAYISAERRTKDGIDKFLSRLGDLGMEYAVEREEGESLLIYAVRARAS